MHYRRFTCVRCPLLLTTIALLAGVALGAHNKPNVLVLAAYQPELPWSENMVKGIRAGLDRDVELSVEYMDTKRFYSEDYLDLLRNVYAWKYRRMKPDLVVACDDNAFNFMRRRHEDLFPDVPLVFCGVNHLEKSMLDGHPLFTGVHERLYHERTVALALKLHPRARQVIVISDSTVTGRGNLKIIQTDVAPRFPDVPFLFWDEQERLTVPDLETRLSQVAVPSVVLISDFFRDGEGHFVDYREALPRLAAASPWPIYGPGDFYLGYGAVGGHVASAFTQGKAAGGMAARILDGAPVGRIPVVWESPNVYMFDHRQLERFGIDEARLPEGAIIVNRPDSFYARHRAAVNAVAGFILVQALIIVGLIVNILRRRRAERLVEDGKRHLEAMLNNTPDLAWLKDVSGRYIAVNQSFADELGLSAAEIVGRTDNELWPAEAAERFRAEDREVMRTGARMRIDVPIGRGVGGQWSEAIKSPIVNADGEALGVVGIARDMTERKRYEDEMQRLVTAIEQAAESIIVTDPDRRILFVNPAFETISGYSRDEATGRDVIDLLRSGEHPEAFYQEFDRALSEGTVWKGRISHLRKGGEVYLEDMAVSPVRDKDGRIVNFVSVAHDVTHEVRLEEQLQQAQKMESVGQLAGGIAHDFNNILSAILGYADLASQTLNENSAISDLLKEITRAGARARDLTRQLLAFSRKQMLEMCVLNVNHVLQDIETMLRRLLGENIDLRFNLNETIGNVKADRSQLQQVVMNMALNARDAMPHGGRLTVETSETVLDNDLAQAHFALAPGRYALLSVSDTGEGIAPDLLDRVFEPFFTTKDVGKGTGLGLSTVHGIVKQHGGDIRVYSEPGYGTTFRVYLPVVDSPIPETVSDAPAEAVAGGGETILVVEDDGLVRRLACQILRTQNYTVLEADGAEAALRLQAEYEGRIDGLLTDVMMPQMNGCELHRRLDRLRPGLKVLFMSGYSGDVLAHQGLVEGGLNFLQKPFSAKDLTGKIRQMLGHGTESVSSADDADATGE